MKITRKTQPIDIESVSFQKAKVNPACFSEVTNESINSLDPKRVRRLENLLFGIIEITKRDSKIFTIFINSLFQIVKNEVSEGVKLKAFLVGGEVGNVQEDKTSSSDIDTQCKLPKYTDKSVFNLIVSKIKHYVAFQARITVDELEEEKILKIVPVWNEHDRFFTISFRSSPGVKYDFNIVARLARKYLFFHDALKIPLHSLLFSNGKNTLIIPQNLLNNGIDPITYRKNKIIDTEKADRINFPGCMRLISNYVKGFVCKDSCLEKTLINSLFTQLDSNPKYDLKYMILHDIKEHHDKKYEAAVAFAFNFLTAILRYSHEHRYEGVRDIFIEILLELEKTALTDLLSVIESAIFRGYPSLLSLAEQFPAVSLEKREDIDSTLYQQRCGDYYLLFQKTPEKMAKSQIPVDVVQKKKAGKPKVKKMRTPICKTSKVNSKQEKTHKQLIKKLTISRPTWKGEEIEENFDGLISYLHDTKTLASETRKIIGGLLKVFLKHLLEVDNSEKYCIPLCEQWIRHTISTKLNPELKNAFLQQWKRWLTDSTIQEEKLDKIYLSFISTSSIELSLAKVKIFLDVNLYQKAKPIADSLKQNQIPNELRLELLEKIDNPNTFEALEQFILYQHLILTSPKAEVFKETVNNALILLKNRKLTPHRLRILIDGGYAYKSLDSDFWRNVLSKALMSDKNYQQAINVFFNGVLSLRLMKKDPQSEYEFWKLLLLKMCENHDQKLKTLLEDPYPIYNLTGSSHFLDSSPLLNLLAAEAFYLLKNNKFIKKEEGFIFEFLSNISLNSRDALTFVSIYLNSFNEHYFNAACEKFAMIAPNLGGEKLIELCSQMGRKKNEFNSEDIKKHIINVVTIFFKDKTLFEQFNIAAAVARECPEVKDILIPITTKLVSNLQAEEITTAKPKMNQVITVLTDVILTADYIELVDIVCELLSSTSYLEKANVEETTTFWATLIKNTLDAYLKRPYKENAIKGLDFFYKYICNVYGNLDYEFECISRATATLNRLYTNHLPIYLENVEKFYDFLAEGNHLWKLPPTPEALKQPISDPINEIKNYRILLIQDREGTSIGEYIPPAHLAELQKNSIENFSQWVRFSSGATCVCEELLESIPVSKEHDVALMNLVTRSLELIMIRDAAIAPDIRKSIAEGYQRLLNMYISRSVYETADVFANHLRNISYLYSCALSCGYVNVLEPQFLRNIFYLDKEIVRISKIELSYQYEDELYNLARGVAEEGDVYQLFRLCSIFSEKKDILNSCSYKFKRNYISVLKRGIKRFPQKYKDKDGFPIGKIISDVKL